MMPLSGGGGDSHRHVSKKGRVAHRTFQGLIKQLECLLVGGGDSHRHVCKKARVAHHTFQGLIKQL